MDDTYNLSEEWRESKLYKNSPEETRRLLSLELLKSEQHGRMVLLEKLADRFKHNFGEDTITIEIKRGTYELMQPTSIPTSESDINGENE